MTDSNGVVREFPLPPSYRMPTRDPAEVPVRDAATVMLVRPAAPPAAGVEVFTFRRRPSLVFAAGMLVFPGGAVEGSDGDDGLPWEGPPPVEVAAAPAGPGEAPARALVAAAVRETFEECGVLLAGAPGGGPPLGRSLDGPVWEARREALLSGDLTLGALLRDAGLVLRSDLLRPWARWITPAGEPRRFDTRFFAAPLPAGQAARDLGGEGEHAAWRSPSAVLAEYRDGGLPMLPPTVVAMEELAAAGSVEALLGTRRRLRPVSPWPVAVDGSEDGPEGGPVRYVMRVHLDGHGGGEPGPGPGPGPGGDRGAGADVPGEPR